MGRATKHIRLPQGATLPVSRLKSYCLSVRDGLMITAITVYGQVS